MGLNKLIEAIAILVLLAASTGQLPKIVAKVQIAQLQLLKALNYFGTSAADFIQIVGFISIVVLALFLLVQFGNKKQTSQSSQCFDSIAIKT